MKENDFRPAKIIIPPDGSRRKNPTRQFRQMQPTRDPFLFPQRPRRGRVLKRIPPGIPLKEFSTGLRERTTYRRVD